MEAALILITIVILLGIGIGVFLLLNTIFGKPIERLKSWSQGKPNLKRIGNVLFWIGIVFLSFLAIYSGYLHALLQFDAYRGVEHNKFSFLGVMWSFFFFAGSALGSVLFVAVSASFRSKALRLVFIPVALNILALVLPFILFALPSYDYFMTRKAEKIVKSSRFVDLRETFNIQKEIRMMSILKRTNTVIVNDFVMNIDSISCGPIPKLFGFMASYYRNADSLHFDSFSELFETQDSTIDSASFFSIYELMMATDLREIRRRRNCSDLSEFLFHSSGMAGERGIIERSKACAEDDKKDSTVVLETDLAPDLSYVYRKGWQPF